MEGNDFSEREGKRVREREREAITSAASACECMFRGKGKKECNKKLKKASERGREKVGCN